jgi:putative acetyltransferase
MEQNFSLKRTTTADKDFQFLVTRLDHELWVELKEDQATYDQHNKVPDIKTALLIYMNEEPAACGCFKEFDGETVEIKRMFVQKTYRGLGLSKKILHELEQWAIEKNYRQAILETSIHFKTARKLYETNGYSVIPNYPPYVGLAESVCMKKELVKR